MIGFTQLQWQGDRLLGCLAAAARSDDPVELRLDGVRFDTVHPDADGRFQFDLPFSPTGRATLSIALRRGAVDLLPEAWLVSYGLALTYPAHAHSGEAAGLRPLTVPWMNSGNTRAALAEAPPVAIIIAVHNAAADVERCLRSVFRHTCGAARLIVIDDASSEPAVATLLGGLAGRRGVSLLRNAQNRGYTGSVNSALAATQREDIVLLNSDTEVGPCWLEGLRRAAYSDAKIGSATAVSDNAGAFSVPELEQANDLPIGTEFDVVARALWQQAGLLRPALPTGNGFCMYVRRSMLDAVGGPDAEAFPQGYGEENDWCMRAATHGFRHVIAGNVFVRHARSKSFGHERRLALGQAGMAVLRQRYPHYEAEVAATLFRYERRALDFRVRWVFAALADGRLGKAKPRVLFVVGAPSDLDRDLTRLGSEIEAFALSWCDGRLQILRHDSVHWRLESQQLLAPCVANAPSGWDAYEGLVSDWVEAYAIEFLHPRCLDGHSPRLAALAHSVGVHVVREDGAFSGAVGATDWAQASLRLYAQTLVGARSFSERKQDDGERDSH